MCALLERYSMSHLKPQVNTALQLAAFLCISVPRPVEHTVCNYVYYSTQILAEYPKNILIMFVY